MTRLVVISRKWIRASLQNISWRSLLIRHLLKMSLKVKQIFKTFSHTSETSKLISRALGILHTIFFHRYFTCVRPSSFEVLDLTLPAIDDVNLGAQIDSRVDSLIQQHLSSSSSNSPNGGVRGRMAVRFFEKRRRKGAALWFGGTNEEQVCWETWTIDITIAIPRTESGMCGRTVLWRATCLWVF